MKRTPLLTIELVEGQVSDVDGSRPIGWYVLEGHTERGYAVKNIVGDLTPADIEEVGTHFFACLDGLLND